MIHNVHERYVRANVGSVGDLLDTLSSKNDRLWPRGQWPSMRLDRQLGIGASGGHGPVRYVVDTYEPGQSVRFRFTSPSGFHGHHAFTVSACADEGTTLLTHELTMTVTGLARVTWPLFFRPLHDALIEESFDRAESEVGSPPELPATRPLWTRILRLVTLLPRTAPSA